MRYLYLLLASALMALLFVSCSVSVPDQITRLANKVEKKGDKYTLEDWEKAAQKMEKLVLKFADNYDSYTYSERAQVVKALAIFSAKAVKCGAQGVLDKVDFDSFSNGFMDGANELLNGAKGLLEGLGF